MDISNIKENSIFALLKDLKETYFIIKSIEFDGIKYFNLYCYEQLEQHGYMSPYFIHEENIYYLNISDILYPVFKQEDLLNLINDNKKLNFVI